MGGETLKTVQLQEKEDSEVLVWNNVAFVCAVGVVGRESCRVMSDERLDLEMGVHLFIITFHIPSVDTSLHLREPRHSFSPTILSQDTILRDEMEHVQMEGETHLASIQLGLQN